MVALDADGKPTPAPCRKIRAVPVKTESLELLYPFVSTHYPTQSRFAPLLEML